MKYESMSFEEWKEKYKPDTSSDGSVIAYETYGEDHKYLVNVSEERGNKVLWTLIDNNDGDGEIIVTGYHYVNRINYFITEIPFKEFGECMVELDGSEDIFYRL